MSNTNNFNGTISMNPKKLYEISLTGVEVEEKVRINYQKLNTAIEDLIQSVKTPELNSQLKNLYEIFKKIEENFNNNNSVVNDFFANKIQEYTKHAENITEVSNTLIHSAGFEKNDGVNSSNIVHDNQINVKDYSYRETSQNDSVDDFFNNQRSTDFKSDDLGLKEANSKSFANSNIKDNDNVISLDPREWEGFGPKVDK